MLLIAWTACALSIGNKDIRKKEALGWCAKRAGIVNGKVGIVEVCI